MGREVRRVPAGWQHPKDEDGRYVPLFDGKEYATHLRDWNEEKEKWDRGEFPDYADDESRKMRFEDWDGPRPDAKDYMPLWHDAERTHFMMYETTTEGTPISPAFETPEELARWLTDTQASAFGNMTADYEHWLRVAEGAVVCSAAVIAGGGLISGVMITSGGEHA